MIKSEAFLSIQKRSAVIINQPRFSSPHLLKDSLTPSVPPLLLPREGEEMSTAEHPPPTVSISSYQAAGRGQKKRTLVCTPMSALQTGWRETKGNQLTRCNLQSSVHLVLVHFALMALPLTPGDAQIWPHPVYASRQRQSISIPKLLTGI